ncbi:ABC transporter ATP-binding protein [Dongia deserti]|uniref:ABC transporter ATP-binding protein n=1 Tax=Dongia deserti TaxID=2268030 RepID=UPI002549BC21|nr:ABC transporter ATP-binding protein [Dongia deserti]
MTKIQSQLLDIADLHVEIPTARGMVKAVDSVTLSVRAGEAVGIVGESGSGKSMLALSIMQLVPRPGRIASGRISLAGRDLLQLSEREMRQVRGNEVGMIFQDPSTSLNPVLRVGRQVAETIEAHHPAADSWQQSVDMLRSVSIPDPQRRVRDYPHQYSGGMRQRVMIAIGMANRPKLLIADEPTTALDVTVQAQIMDLLRSMNAETGTAILLISHNIALVSRFCSRVLVMYAGRIVEEGPTAELFHQPKHPYTRALLSALPRIDRKLPQGLTTIGGRPPDLARLPAGCAFFDRCQDRIETCRTERPPAFSVGPGRSARCWLADEGKPSC